MSASLVDSPTLGGTRRIREDVGGIPARKRLIRRTSKESSMYRSALMDFGNDLSNLSLTAALLHGGEQDDVGNKLTSNESSNWLNFTVHGFLWCSTTIRKSLLTLLIRKKSAEVMGIEAPPLDEVVIQQKDHIICVEYLEKIVKSSHYKNDLVDRLLGEHFGQVTIWVHFVSAVLELRNTKEWKRRQQKSRLIMKLFIVKGSKYRLSGINYSTDDIRMVMRRKFSLSFLPKLMLVVEKELLKNRIVIDFLQEVHNHDDVMSIS
jgi:hypothetical protein